MVLFENGLVCFRASHWSIQGQAIEVKDLVSILQPKGKRIRKKGKEREREGGERKIIK